MADVFSKRKRSEVRSRIRGRGNQATELALATLFRRHKISGWRRQVQVRIAERGVRNKAGKRATGNSFRTPHSARRVFTARPDFVFLKLRTVIFVDGCYWHGCPKHATWPANRAAWWRRKILGNEHRDALVTRTLRKAGWRVVRVWEHELATKNEARLVRRLAVFLVA